MKKIKILITGGCGFVGTNLAIYLKKKFRIECLDNLSRKGSRYNLNLLKYHKIKNFNFDIANYKKILQLPKYDLIIDCCAEAAVEVSKKEIDRVINTNLLGTINLLKKVKKDQAKIIFLSSSRVYSISKLNELIKSKNIDKKIDLKKLINEKDDTSGAKSIYGLTKLSSEMFVEEFSYAFNIKYIINRCGVISGPLQFGKQDQGFVSLWVWKHINKSGLNYMGYGGHGNQVRDVLHIDDLCRLILLQIKKINKINNKKFTVGGSKKSYTSLVKLTKICEKITKNKIKIGRNKTTSIYDIPYFITDNKLVKKTYGWSPSKNIYDVVRDTYIWISKNKKKLIKFF
jgi:CDP-paratose 2-epimerase